MKNLTLALAASSLVFAVGCATCGESSDCGYVKLDPKRDFVGVKTKGESFPANGWTIDEEGVLAVWPRSKIVDGKWQDLPPEQKKLGGGGGIYTRKVYRDFAFKLEFKLTPGANSGIKYYFVPGKNKGTCEECQILHPAHPDSTKGCDGNRRIASLYDLIPAKADALLKELDWNTMEVVAKGRTVQHWLNGVKVVEYERGGEAFRAAVDRSKYKTWGTDGNRWGELEAGHILLQDHGDSKVFFRNIRVKEL